MRDLLAQLERFGIRLPTTFPLPRAEVVGPVEPSPADLAALAQIGRRFRESRARQRGVNTGGNIPCHSLPSGPNRVEPE